MQNHPIATARLLLPFCLAHLLGCTPPGLEAAASQPPAQGAVQSTPLVRDVTSAVRLVYTNVYDSGCPTCTVARGFIEVGNLAYQKQVPLVYSLDGGPFQEFGTWFRATIDSQREIWWFQLGLQRSLRFALRYAVAGQQYWDNNGGQDYEVTVDAATGAFTGAALGLDRDVALTSAAVPGLDNPSELDVTMFVRDLASHKDVAVIYSADGWATRQTAAAQFGQSLGGVEQWAVRAPLSGGNPSRIDFAVAATQAGGTQWDNNYGQNFSCFLCKSRSCQDWVCMAPTLP